MARRHWLASVWALVALALVVRLFGLTSRDLSYDEQVTLVDSQSVRSPSPGVSRETFVSSALRDIDAGLFSVARQSATHDQPVYVSLIYLWLSLVGASEVTLRLPSALFGAASVGLVAVVGRTLVGEYVALLAGLLLSVSPVHVLYSQQGRVYAMAGFLALLAMALLLRLSDKSPARSWIAYGAAAASTPLVHILAAVALFPHVVVLWRLRRQRRQLALAAMGALIVLGASLPLGWMESVRTAHEQSGVALASPPADARNWARPATVETVVAGLGSSMTRVLGLDYFPFEWRARYLLPLSAALLLIGLSAGWSRPQPERTLLLASALLPHLAAVALSIHYGHVVPLQASYSAWTMPFWMLLLADGASQLRGPRVARSAFALIFTLLAGFLVGGRWVGSPRVEVRSSEIRSFMACAPGEVLHVSGAWEAAVVTALAPRESNLRLKVATSGEAARMAFLAGASGICRNIDAGACETQFPVCATED